MLCCRTWRQPSKQTPPRVRLCWPALCLPSASALWCGAPSVTCWAASPPTWPPQPCTRLQQLVVSSHVTSPCCWLSGRCKELHVSRAGQQKKWPASLRLVVARLRSTAAGPGPHTVCQPGAGRKSLLAARQHRVSDIRGHVALQPTPHLQQATCPEWRPSFPRCSQSSTVGRKTNLCHLCAVHACLCGYACLSEQWAPTGRPPNQAAGCARPGQASSSIMHAACTAPMGAWQLVRAFALQCRKHTHRCSKCDMQKGLQHAAQQRQCQPGCSLGAY